ncbi:MAG TPA: hypothetical protein VFZ36_10150, partial [Vicinamibacterales bacterium]
MRVLAAFMFGLLWPAPTAEAQERTPSEPRSSTSLVASAQALLAYQSDDDRYATGSCGQLATYLNCGPGGFAPGIAGGVHYARAALVAGVEASVARFSVRQEGRLARGNAVATSIDTLVSAVIGIAETAGNYRISIVAGGTRVFTRARQKFPDGSISDPADSLRHEPHPYTASVGFDVVRRLSSRN